MKLTARKASFLLLAHVAVAFQPTGLISTIVPRDNSNRFRLNAIGDDVPDIVKAYQKSKSAELPSPIDPGATDTTATLSTTPTIPPDSIPDVTAQSTTAASPQSGGVNAESFQPYVDSFIKSAKERYASTAASIVFLFN